MITRKSSTSGRQNRFLWLTLCLMGTRLCQAQIGFQVSPSKLFFNHQEANPQTVRLHIANTMDTRLVLQATCADWRRDSTGSKVYYPAGSLPTSCCSLVQVTPSVIDMAPGEERDVLVTMLGDQQTTSGLIRNSMLLLTQSNEQEMARLKGNTSQLVIRVQMGIHLYVLPAENQPPDIAITDLGITKTGEQNIVKVQVHNNGGTLLESQLRLEYLNTETMEELKAEPIPVNTMPKDLIRVVAVVPPTLLAGKYLIVAVLDSGPGQALKVAELETTLK